MQINAQLVVDDGEQNLSIPLPAECIAALVEQLPDNATHASIFGCLSRHSASSVRAAIAQKRFLPRTAVARLTEDPAIEVISGLLYLGSASASLSAADILAICRRDSGLAKQVAGNCTEFACDDAVFEFLETHSDEHVRARLVDGCRVPRAVLQRMLQRDTDAGVREAARRALDRGI